MSGAYYNEIDPYAAQWLRNLIAAGHLPGGEVDERDIREVQPDDVRPFAQAHFFAGIGGWGLAARLAGFPDSRALWTGSCPCQPFSVAGKGAGASDERHLWPEFFRLIAAVRPPVVMGEQVAAAVGKSWLDGVSSDLEGIGYACGAAVVPACAVNAPHRRDRLWFVADAQGISGRSRLCEAEQDTGRNGAPSRGGAVDVADADSQRPFARTGNDQAPRHGDPPPAAGGAGPWAGAAWLIGAYGKARRVEPGVCLLAHGVPARVGRLRAYGNAIVPQVAAEVIGAFMEVRRDTQTSGGTHDSRSSRADPVLRCAHRARRGGEIQVS